MEGVIPTAIILAGGLGSRLGKEVLRLPKPMVDVSGRPFITYILDRLVEQAVAHIVISTGYKHQVIANYVGQVYKGVKITYAIDPEPLGTGGGIINALNHVDSSVVLICNGDTFFNISLKKFAAFHFNYGADVSVALKSLSNVGRYGVVELDAKKNITSFGEKTGVGSGNINGGVYILRSDLFGARSRRAPNTFSFEKEFLEKKPKGLNIKGEVFADHFIDIGVPADLQLARENMMSWL